MNQRAIELYKQAAEFAYEKVDKEFYDTTALQGVIMGKFTELIIRECAHVGFNAAYPDKGVDVLIAIEKHFGIE